MCGPACSESSRAASDVAVEPQAVERVEDDGAERRMRRFRTLTVNGAG